MVKGARVIEKLISDKDLIGGRMTKQQSEMAYALQQHHVIKDKRLK